MLNNLTMKKIFICFFLFGFVYAQAQQGIMGELTVLIQKKKASLFNGKNLDGWYTFLNSKGKNNDPEKIFAIEDGLLHISGKEFGYISTNKVYRNFVFAVEYKWGTKKYPPRDADSVKRDNGICYYFPLNERDTVWPKSIECQIQEGDTGDFWLIDSTTIITNGARTEPGTFVRIQKKLNAEKPTGQWNRIEIIANNGKLVYIVNGKIVNEGEAPSVNAGKILIQSEGAEIYYRKIEIAEL
jgi:hypothetical protein